VDDNEIADAGRDRGTTQLAPDTAAGAERSPHRFLPRSVLDQPGLMSRQSRRNDAVRRRSKWKRKKVLRERFSKRARSRAVANATYSPGVE
jgi:hypothetical protein